MQKSEGESNMKELFEEFKFHLIYKNKLGKASPIVNDDYKELLGVIREENRVKRAKIRNLGTQQDQENKREAPGSRPNTSLRTRIWKPAEMECNQLDECKEGVIVMEQEREGLMSEIANLQTSLKHLKKNLAGVRKEVEIETTKVEKYKHIEYLATSINMNTEAVKINNSRSYKQLINQQEDTLGNLKQFRVNLKKDNEELESKLMQSRAKKQSRVLVQ